MTKAELLREYNALCDANRIHIDGIYTNSNKDEIQNAIDCLKCSDDVLNDYMTIIKLKYPNTHSAISKTGDYRKHSYNRLYVFNTARLLLA